LPKWASDTLTRVVAAVGLVLAHRRAAAAVHGVAVVTLLGRLDDAVAAHLLVLAHHVAAVAGEDVAVVALFAIADNAITADGRTIAWSSSTAGVTEETARQVFEWSLTSSIALSSKAVGGINAWLSNFSTVTNIIYTLSSTIGVPGTRNYTSVCANSRLALSFAIG